MKEKESFSTVRVPKSLRVNLKRLSAEREEPMYLVLEDLVRKDLERYARHTAQEGHCHAVTSLDRP